MSDYTVSFRPNVAGTIVFIRPNSNPLASSWTDPLPVDDARAAAEMIVRELEADGATVEVVAADPSLR